MTNLDILQLIVLSIYTVGHVVLWWKAEHKYGIFSK